MKRQTEREFVSIRKDKRSDNGKEYFTVTWTPQPGQRKRKIFSGPNAEQKATEEADWIESILQQGLTDLSKISRSRLAIINTLCEKLPDDNGLTLLSLLQNYLKNNIDYHDSPTVQTIGEQYIESRSSSDDFSERHRGTVRLHMQKFIKAFGPRPINAVNHAEIKHYLEKMIGGSPKTRLQHLITIRAFFRWARDIQKCLPYGVATAAECVQPPKIKKSEHQIYTPEEITRLLVFAPADLIQFYTLGQFAGVRASERTRLMWGHWRRNEGNNLVLNQDVTKTNQRRLVDVLPNLEKWLSMFKGNPQDFMVPCKHPFKYTPKIAEKAGVAIKQNALRAGYASYHLELFNNAALTAKNDGHTIAELLTTYRSITGVTKKSAQEMFSITPHTVIKYAHMNNLPEPEWSEKCWEAHPNNKNEPIEYYAQPIIAI